MASSSTLRLAAHSTASRFVDNVLASRWPRTSICTRQVPAAVCFGVDMNWGEKWGEIGGTHCATRYIRRTLTLFDFA